MAFFDSFPPPEPPKRPRRARVPAWRMPDRNVKPVALAFDAILVRREELAVYVNGVNVYPNGFTLTITTLRRQTESAGPREPGSRNPNPFGSHHYRGVPASTEDLEGVLRLGVRFADGRSAVADGIGMWRGDDEPSGPPTVNAHSGHGNESEWVQGLWVWGIPEAGDVDVVYSWAAEAVPESRFELDGDVIREAATRAVTLWDDSEYDHEGDDDA
jgi:hypothetical protein